MCSDHFFVWMEISKVKRVLGCLERFNDVKETYQKALQAEVLDFT